MLSILCVRLTIKVKVGIPESFKVGWYLPKKTGSSHLKFTIVSYCFAIKAIKHKISKVFTVTCADVFVQIQQSSCTIQYKNGPYVLQNCFFVAPRFTLTRQNKAQ